MGLSWRSFVALAAALMAASVTGVSSADSGAPLEVDVMFSTFLQNLREMILNIPNALKEAANRLTHPVRTIGGLIDFFRPDHFIKLPRRHLRCTCDNVKSCMCCVNVTIPLFNRGEHLCQNLTFFPGNLSTAVNIISNNRSLIRTVLSGPGFLRFGNGERGNSDIAEVTTAKEQTATSNITTGSPNDENTSHLPSPLESVTPEVSQESSTLAPSGTT